MGGQLPNSIQQIVPWPATMDLHFPTWDETCVLDALGINRQIRSPFAHVKTREVDFESMRLTRTSLYCRPRYVQQLCNQDFWIFHVIWDADDVVQTSVSASVTTREEKAEIIQPSSQTQLLEQSGRTLLRQKRSSFLYCSSLSEEAFPSSPRLCEFRFRRGTLLCNFRRPNWEVANCSILTRDGTNPRSASLGPSQLMWTVLKKTVMRHVHAVVVQFSKGWHLLLYPPLNLP